MGCKKVIFTLPFFSFFFSLNHSEISSTNYFSLVTQQDKIEKFKMFLILQIFFFFNSILSTGVLSILQKQKIQL